MRGGDFGFDDMDEESIAEPELTTEPKVSPTLEVVPQMVAAKPTSGAEVATFGIAIVMIGIVVAVSMVSVSRHR